MAVKPLFKDDFVIESEKTKAKRIVKKIAKPKTISATSIIKSKTTSISEKLEVIYKEVDRILGVYKRDTVVITNIIDFINYIDAAIKTGLLVIDTETNNSLDPLTCKLMGLCLYTPGQKNAYIPVNHTDLDGNKLSNQIAEEQIKEQLDRANRSCKNIFHNAKFDYKVLYCTCELDLNIFWDTLVGAHLLNENEEAKLKLQYIQKVDPTIEKYSIDHLFEGVLYQYVDPTVFALYAATDSFMTYKLYLYQLAQFNKIENFKIFKLFNDVEIPILKVVAKMEIEGINIDDEYAKRLGKKYHEKASKIEEEISVELNNLAPQITAWRATEEATRHLRKAAAKNNTNKAVITDSEYKVLSTEEKKAYAKSKDEQLANPVVTTSPTQLAILFYDILKVPVIDPETPRGTGTDILKELANNYPIAKLLVEQRTILKLLDSFIDALPELKCAKDGKIHAKFNPLGARTGRFSCTAPNLQQIPSKNNEVRMLFKASKGYTFVSADFSAQEPRITSALSGDEKMIKAYQEDKDLYAMLGTAAFHNDYWDNMEHYEDGTSNVEGKARRKKCKTLLLGLSYGMGDALTAQRMNVSVKEAKNLINNLFDGYQGLKAFIDNNELTAQQYGYVEDPWGRKRRLPDAMLPDYEFSENKYKKDFNPLFRTSGEVYTENPKLYNSYLVKLKNARSNKERQAIKADALKNNVKIKDNGAFISRAARQSTNARIQGGAATMTKKAMINIANDKLMADLGFKLLISVHDELIGECPIENAEAAADRLSYLMSTCVADTITTVPFKCDVEIEDRWYLQSYTHQLQKDFKDLLHSGLSENSALNKIYEDHSEHLPETLKEALSNIE